MPTSLRLLLLVLSLLAGSLKAGATHLVGGEIVYRYLDASGPAGTPFRYELTALVYLNREPSSAFPYGRPAITLTIADRTRNTIIDEYIVPRSSVTEVTEPVGSCSGLTSRPPRVSLAKYTAVVNLPPTATGYRVELAETARNAGITNLANSGNQAMVLSTDLAPPFLPNASPVFSDTAVANICLGDTATLLNNAFDADGDRLSYAFGTPSGNFAPTYSQALPFGVGGVATLEANTGLSRYHSRQQGRFVVAVDVSEYRMVNGQEILLGSIRRDIQLIVRTCPGNNAPAFIAPTPPVRNLTLIEGESVAFSVAATDPENQALALRVSSVLLDGAGPFNATFNGNPGTLRPGSPIGSVTTSGTGSVNGTFAFTARCGSARPQAYDVVVTATDNACASKTVSAVFRLTINRAAAPSRISGDSLVCALNTGIYTAVGASASAYRWRVQGGQIQGATDGRSIQVLWGTGPGGAVSVAPVSTCTADSATRAITVVPSNFVALGPAPVICPGAEAELAGSGAQTYTWTGGGLTLSGPSVRVRPLQTTTYVLYAVNGTCTTSRYVTVTVAPLRISGPASFCPEARTNLAFTATALTGSSYQWTATGATITAGQGTDEVRVDVLPGATAATLQVASSTGCGASFALRYDPARPQLAVATVAPESDDRSVQLGLQVPDATPATASLTVLRRAAGSGAAFQSVGTAASTALTFTDAGAEADARAYDYRVELRNSCGTVLASQDHTTMLTAVAELEPPQGRSAGRLRVEWTPYQGFAVQTYTVERQVDGGAPELVATLAGSARSLELPAGGLGFNQCFRVRAYSAADAATFSASNQACLVVENKLGTYNIITPNGDGLNDALVIDNAALYPGNTLTVFNRWGRQLYQARDYANTYDGQGASTGLYYYLFRLPDGSTRKGWFEIVR